MTQLAATGAALPYAARAPAALVRTRTSACPAGKRPASDCINPHHYDAGRTRPNAAPQRASPSPQRASKPPPQARHAGAEGTARADIKARLP